MVFLVHYFYTPWLQLVCFLGFASTKTLVEFMSAWHADGFGCSVGAVTKSVKWMETTSVLRG